MTNAAAIGYMIRAAKLVGLADQKIKEIEATMRDCMDFMCEWDAEQVYNKF